MNFHDSVSLLKGVGPKKKEILNQIGIITNIDLLYYFPRKYLDRSITENIILREGEQVTLLGSVLDKYLAHGKKSRLIVGFQTLHNERISLIFFKGLSFFQKIFQEGMIIAVSGKIEYFRGFQIIHPDYEIISKGSHENPNNIDPDEYDLTHTGRIIPLYSSTEALKQEGLDSRGFRRLIKQIIDSNLNIPEILPPEVIKKRKLLTRKNAFTSIHFPENNEELNLARYRFAYEELYFFNLLVEYKKSQRNKIKRELWPIVDSKTEAIVRNNLPYTLTTDQESALLEIRNLTQSEQPMAVLLQGDVGSGKTIVAFLTALHYTDNDVQVAFVAPTEILARQHFLSIFSFLGNMPFLGIDLLLGGENKKSRNEKLQRLSSGETSILIGTHSLFQKDIIFKDLGLVIFDEQHKFGVDQRELLRSKGKNPDILAMTATPIPRTLCLTLYGDLNLITIKHKPSGRKPIDTRWYTEERRAGVYKAIKKYVDQGRQCYIVYPLVEESEKLDLKSCIESFENLNLHIFPDYNLGLLHGKMKNAEKETVMDAFKKNEIQILVTTTVVEVGVDVPNATVLVIEHADRFGISQLHQLRGRVGRGTHESFCILMTSNYISDDAKIRINALLETEDGFKLAETDMKLRGPGELLGVRQSGLPDFKIANLQDDTELIIQSKEDAIKYNKLNDLEKLEIRYRFEEGRMLFPN